MKSCFGLLAFVLILLGGGASGYLLARHFAVAGGDTESFDICSAVFRGDCDAAIRSDLAVQLGIPLAGWGLVHFVMLAAALSLGKVLGESFRAEATLFGLFSCTVATVGGAVLTFIMLTSATAFCPLCACIHAINLVLIPAVKLGSGLTADQLLASVSDGFKYLTGKDTGASDLVRWRIVGLVTIALSGIVSYQWILIQTDRRLVVERNPGPTFAEVLLKFQQLPSAPIPHEPDEPRLGTTDSSVRLIVFSDFQCPICRWFAADLMRIRKRHPDVAIVFKHYPLSDQCNDGVSIDLHPLSCGAALAVEAAKRQEKFWEYHDAIFAAKQELQPETLRELAGNLSLDLDRFESDLNDPAVAERVQSDIALANALEVSGTPTVFLNGKKLTGNSMSMLEPLIEYMLKQSSN